LPSENEINAIKINISAHAVPRKAKKYFTFISFEIYIKYLMRLLTVSF